VRRAHAFGDDRSIYDLAFDAAEPRLRFEEWGVDFLGEPGRPAAPQEPREGGRR
jgi:hypothetical protein